MMRISRDTAILKVTTIEHDLDSFESHSRRLLQHTAMEAIDWVNIQLHTVTFKTLRRAGRKM